MDSNQPNPEKDFFAFYEEQMNDLGSEYGGYRVGQSAKVKEMGEFQEGWTIAQFYKDDVLKKVRVKLQKGQKVKNPDWEVFESWQKEDVGS